MNEPETRRYLGDGLYATIERGMLKLYTHDGIETGQTIYLDPAVLWSLLRYVKELELA